MPYVRCKGLTPYQMQQLSLECEGPLAEILKCDPEALFLEHSPLQRYSKGACISGHPVLEFHMFDRGPETRQAAANYMTQLLQKLTNSEFIDIVFYDLPKTHYFENGQHFGGGKSS